MAPASLAAWRSSVEPLPPTSIGGGVAGIYQINDQENENRIPGLYKIPLLGSLFKNKGTFKRHDELLIFITPRIVKY